MPSFQTLALWPLLCHRSSITSRHLFIQDGSPLPSLASDLSYLTSQGPGRNAVALPSIGRYRSCGYYATQEGLVIAFPAIICLPNLPATVCPVFHIWVVKVLDFTAMWHLLGSWLMVVSSLAAMRERDLFGSFEPQPPNRLYIYCHVGNFPSGCDISPTQPYPCSFVCLSFAETVSSGFSSVHCISSESKSVIKLPKPCKHGNLPIKCEWNA